MKVKLHYQFNEVDGTQLTNKFVETNYEDPIFLNMQFCMEREQFNKLMKLCVEYKLEDIHHAIQTILDESDPEQIINLAAY